MVVVGVLVAGVAWYRDRRGEDLLLPVETVVFAARVAECAAAGRFAVWTLPEGGVAVDRRHLPLEPVEIDRVFPLEEAEEAFRRAEAGGRARPKVLIQVDPDTDSMVESPLTMTNLGTELA